MSDPAAFDVVTPQPPPGQALSPSTLSPPPGGAEPEAPSPYIEYNGAKIQWAWDASSLSMLKRCPREYFYGQIMGLRRKRKSAPATFGGAFAKAMEVYETEKPKIGHGPAIAAAQAAATAASEGMEDHKTRTREALLRSVGAYLAHHETDSLETLPMTDGAPAVELHFQVPFGQMRLPFADKPEVVLCGYMDRVVRFQGVPYVLDNKTTGASISTEKGSAAYFANYTPDNQVSAYTWAARTAFNFPVRGVIIDAMQIAKTKTEFARQIIARTPAQIDEWRASVPYYVGLATMSALATTDGTVKDPLDAYPMNETSCHKYGGCSYRGICGKDPSVRKAFLDTDYEVRPWNPLAPRTKGTIAPEAAAEEESASDA